LLRIEVEKTQRQGTGAIMYTAQQTSTFAIANLGQLDLAFYSDGLPGAQAAYGYQVGTVLVT
jgi:hypothetical protein